jgi:hypothetical protein
LTEEGNPYFPDESIAEPEVRSRRRPPVRVILWTALLLAVVIATVVLAFQLHEQNNRIKRLQNETKADNDVVVFLLHHDCPITCAPNYNQPAG